MPIRIAPPKRHSLPSFGADLHPRRFLAWNLMPLPIRFGKASSVASGRFHDRQVVVRHTAHFL